MTDTLLTSENFIKSVVSIFDNIAGKYIQSAMQEAQEDYRCILGDALTDKLKSLVAAGTISQPANADYNTLLQRSQFYLAYQTAVKILMKVSYKVANAGVVKTSDTNVQNASIDEIAKVSEEYQSNADACCLRLQNFLLNNMSKYPELSENQGHSIKRNLYSSATCGLFLGGARGKKI